MKLLFSIILCLSSFNAVADDAKLLELEQRIQALEKQISNKIESCEMTFKRWTVVSRDCPVNTFAYSAFLASVNGPIQLGCGYYQLRCSRKNSKGETVIEEVPFSMPFQPLK